MVVDLTSLRTMMKKRGFFVLHLHHLVTNLRCTQQKFQTFIFWSNLIHMYRVDHVNLYQALQFPKHQGHVWVEVGSLPGVPGFSVPNNRSWRSQLERPLAWWPHPWCWPSSLWSTRPWRSRRLLSSRRTLPSTESLSFNEIKEENILLVLVFVLDEVKLGVNLPGQLWICIFGFPSDV